MSKIFGLRQFWTRATAFLNRNQKKSEKSEHNIKEHEEIEKEVLTFPSPPISQTEVVGEVHKKETKKSAFQTRKPKRKTHYHWNKVFDYKSDIREALCQLRDEDKKILDYSEEAKGKWLLYTIKIREDKLPVSLWLTYLNERVERQMLAYSTRLFFCGRPDFQSIKWLLNREVEERIKGWRNEDRGFRILTELKEELESGTKYPFKIRSVRRANEMEEKKGRLDFVVELEVEGREKLVPVFIDCKSSLAGREKHKKLGKKVSTIMVTDQRNEEKLKHKYIFIFYRALDNEIAHK